MKLFRSLDEIVQQFANPCVTIGNFDGVHLGHQQLFREVVRRGQQNSGCSIVVTFDPHPLQVLRPGGIKLISTIEQKIEQIEKAGIDVLIIIPFNLAFAATTALHFVDEILLKKIGMTELVVGYDYAFGKGRSGDTVFLKQQGKEKGFPVTVVEAHYQDADLVSSTRIRELGHQGRMMDAGKLLGRPYQIRGVVQIGKQRGGKEIGYPTANLKVNENDLVPRIGVYVTRVICEGKCYGGVLNIGYNPTFSENRLVAETHIFDFNKDIYGKPIKLDLLKFVRDEHKYAGIEELAEQIGRDVVAAKKILSADRKELSDSCAAESGLSS
ncbi:MAG: bifunctional riboflavin kinase/FAD synthetase [Desulfocapsaceae bacterium]|jgi:riboflavin kinase/FMN adenylyltransferase|nr:bifunctional riboflavin kinase/FAD synthetase [Desulfocapsaceae bacterium]